MNTTTTKTKKKSETQQLNKNNNNLGKKKPIKSRKLKKIYRGKRKQTKDVSPIEKKKRKLEKKEIPL